MEDECVSSCKRSVEEMGAAMEIDNIGGGVKTRAMDEVSSKRRRSNSTGSHLVNVPAANFNLMNSSSPANSTTSSSSVNTVVHEQTSDVVINGLRSTDLKLEDSETESSTFTVAEFRETSNASSELCRGDSVDVMESSSTTKSKSSPRDVHPKSPSREMPSTPKDSQRKSSGWKMPSGAEMDAFFDKYEKEQQKRFIEKYNYDIVNDMPLEGRYEWVCLKP